MRASDLVSPGVVVLSVDVELEEVRDVSPTAADCCSTVLPFRTEEHLMGELFVSHGHRVTVRSADIDELDRVGVEVALVCDRHVDEFRKLPIFNAPKVEAPSLVDQLRRSLRGAA